MDHLKSLLRANVDQVGGNISSGSVPSPEQLDGFVRQLVASMNSFLGPSCPPRVKRICAQGFATINWDIKTNRSISRQNRAPAQLLAALETVLANLENWSPSVMPTDAELADLSVACNKLWELDVHRLHPNVDYAVNLQMGKKPYEEGDMAPDPLFTFVHPEALRKPTFSAFIALLDNYTRETGVAEVVTAEEKRENASFLELCMDTAVLQYAHQYLVRKGKADPNPANFIAQLERLWFGLYSREAANDSSGFEHVFLGESKRGEVTGLHNWIQIYLEEQKRTLDYRGYIKPRGRGSRASRPHEEEQMITIQFSWYGELKSVSSSLIGVSPEFEIALYTLCFLCGDVSNMVTLGPYRVEITCHKYTSRGAEYIGTSFPSAVPLEEHEERQQQEVAAKTIQKAYRVNSSRARK